MFIQAIETVANFTRPIYTIHRNYDSQLIQAGASTLFFVNADGWALTCRHVADLIVGAEQLRKKRKDFENELLIHKGKKNIKQFTKELERKYGYSKKETFEIQNLFFNCIEGPLEFEILGSKDYDVALIHFKNFTNLVCTSFPVFAANGRELKQGKYICRLGFPFAEFSNYEYDISTNQLKWTKNGKSETPRFPIEGMVTRRLTDPQGNVMGFELSTPGLKGQSGGPAFDTNGVIWGMQSSTAHLDLDFDIDQIVIRGGTKKKVTDSAFLHVGQCIHVDILKNFMRENGVRFEEK